MNEAHDPYLDALEDADAVLDLDPQRVATIEPEALVTRWRVLRDPALDAVLPLPDARAMLLAQVPV